MRNLLLYAVIGLAFTGAIILLALVRPNISHTSFSFTFFTALLAIFLARMYWPARKMLKVWLLLSLLFAVHIVAFVTLLHYIREWPAFWYVLIMPVEVMIIAGIIYGCLKVLSSKSTI
jgi:hypothetical protein